MAETAQAIAMFHEKSQERIMVMVEEMDLSNRAFLMGIFSY